MPDPTHLTAGVLLLAMIAYVVTGGADFGGGVWELFARGPRGSQQVHALRTAIAPIWEANHVWLILVVVLLFVCFPTAFAAIMVALHVPVTLLLVGIVLRGAGFVFHSYSAGDRAVERHALGWFRAASAIAPLMLGIVVGAIAAGRIRVDPATGAVAMLPGSAWLQPFPLLVGAMTLGLCAFLAAVYMTVETEGALQNDFRRRALFAGVAVGLVALPAAVVADAAAPLIGGPLLHSTWSLPFHACTGAAAVGALVAGAPPPPARARARNRPDRPDPDRLGPGAVSLRACPRPGPDDGRRTAPGARRDAAGARHRHAAAGAGLRLALPRVQGHTACCPGLKPKSAGHGAHTSTRCCVAGSANASRAACSRWRPGTRPGGAAIGWPRCRRMKRRSSPP
jgi:cytochrome d ubiquinol oxidase subunit II